MDTSRLVIVTVEEDQKNTPTCSPGVFIRQSKLTIALDFDVRENSKNTGCSKIGLKITKVIFFESEGN